MLAVVQEGYQHILCIIQQTMASEKSPAAQLRATLFGYVRGMLEDPLLYQVSCRASFLPYKSRLQFCRKICASIEKVLLCCAPVWRKA